MEAKLCIVVATRERPGALAAFLSSLLSQEYYWDTLHIYANGSEHLPDHVDTICQRYINALRVAHRVMITNMGDIGKSPAIAFNMANVDHYDTHEILLFIDDDMWMPPKYLEWMIESYVDLQDSNETPFVLSGVTPWMDAAWEGIGPGVVGELPDEDTPIIELFRLSGNIDTTAKDFDIITRQNIAYDVGDMQTLRPSHAISPGNFMLAPELRIPWSDAGYPFVFADLAWSLQAKYLLDYRFWFDLRCNAFHVNAPSGGLRRSVEDYSKDGIGLEAQEKRVQHLLRAEWP